jgi:hypothetical protein
MVRKLLFIILLGIIVLSSYGCAAFLVFMGTTAGTVAYIKGELKSVEEASLDRTWDAVQKAIKNLEFTTTKKQKEAISAYIITRGADNKKIGINLQKITEELTDVRIRVGVFGNESLSLMILNMLKQNLGIDRGTIEGVVIFTAGELKSIEAVSLDKTWKATQKAVEDSKFLVIHRQKDNFSAVLIARGVDYKKISISLQKVSEELTEIRIRIGVFGDKPLSQLILERLKGNISNLKDTLL